MANLVRYNMLIKGRKQACYTLVWLLPSADGGTSVIREGGTEDEYSILVTDVCKNGVDAYAKRTMRRKPFTEAELGELSCDSDVWYRLQDWSRLLMCDIYCGEVDIDEPELTSQRHFNCGKQMFAEFPIEAIPDA